MTMDQKPICERGVDLVSYLYGESDERKTRDIEMHLRECRNCQAEADSFGQVRESIVAWRDEVLKGFVSSPVMVPAKRSALAAFRQFFDLSPLWLKGAAAFAAVAFCVLAVMLFVNFQKETTAPVQASKTYTEQEVNQLIKDALTKQQTPPIEEKAPEQAVAENPPVRKKQLAKGRRPLSRAEREQLAADLRLVPTDDDLDLLGDRINQ
jgi:hypothetical protein